MFGAGLTTAPECVTEGLPRSSQTLASRAFSISEHASKGGDLRSAARAGSGDPRPTKTRAKINHPIRHIPIFDQNRQILGDWYRLATQFFSSAPRAPAAVIRSGATKTRGSKPSPDHRQGHPFTTPCLRGYLRSPIFAAARRPGAQFGARRHFENFLPPAGQRLTSNSRVA